MKTPNSEALKKFISQNVIIRNPDKPLVMASGLKTDIYFDMKRATLNSQGLALVSAALFEKLKNEYSEKNIQVAGVSVGGDPLVASVLLESLGDDSYPVKSGLLVRKEPKSHGASQGSAVDGAPPAGDGVVLLEDVVSTGGSSLKALKYLQSAGYKVLGLICVINREMAGLEAIKKEFPNIKTDSLFKMSEFV
jgi:orotate phosphoribosyltransferase